MIGQMRVEFIAGVLIFAMLLVFIAIQTNTTFTTLLSDSKNDISKAKNLNVITILTEDKGDPTNWESLAPENVKRVGLASSPYILSASKINSLRSNCSLLSNFNLGSYRLRIYNSTNLMLSCGFGILEAPSSTEVKYVKIGNVYGNITLELW